MEIVDGMRQIEGETMCCDDGWVLYMKELKKLKKLGSLHYDHFRGWTGGIDKTVAVYRIERDISEGNDRSDGDIEDSEGSDQRGITVAPRHDVCRGCASGQPRGQMFTLLRRQSQRTLGIAGYELKDTLELVPTCLYIDSQLHLSFFMMSELGGVAVWSGPTAAATLHVVDDAARTRIVLA